jgi:DNA helicase-2/ATP-dependent DNA helicase PcrA
VKSDGLAQEIAVLYRSNAQSRVIESALFNAGVPYRVYGGLRFFERAEIKHALAYLRLLENPHDDTSFCAWSTFRRAASARARWRLQDAARRAARCTTPSAPCRQGGHQPQAFGLIDVLREQTQGRRCARSSSRC